jgi:hypothetical protein
MTTLRKAVDEYLTMRRNLGFQLHDLGVGLLRFVTFMEERRASYITQQLALEWAQQSSTVQPAEWARRLSFVRTFARYRSATDPRTQIPAEGLLPFRPKRARPYLYTDDEINALLRAALSTCLRGAHSGRGPIIAFSDYSTFPACVSAKHGIFSFRMSI